MQRFETFLAGQDDYAQLADVICRGIHSAAVNSCRLTFLVPSLRGVRSSRLAEVTSPFFISALISGKLEEGDYLRMSLDSAETLSPQQNDGVILALWCSVDMLDALSACNHARHVIALFCNPLGVAEWVERSRSEVQVSGNDGWRLARVSGAQVERVVREGVKLVDELFPTSVAAVGAGGPGCQARPVKPDAR